METKRRKFIVNKEKIINICIPVLLFLIIVLFWIFTYKNTLSGIFVPTYTGEMNALKTLSWTTIWKNVYLSTDEYWYYRYSPTAWFPLALLDRDVYAPMLGINFPSPEFKVASRLIPFGIIEAGLLALAVFLLARSMKFSQKESFIAGIYMGSFKGIATFFRFASTVEAIFLLTIYISITVLFFLRYIQNYEKKYLLGYYLFFLLAVGAFEQWVNLLAFLILFSLLFILINHKWNKLVILHGILIPFFIFIIYLIGKYPYLKLESSNPGQEAEYVFSYDSEKLMAEDIAVNASHHIADVIEPILVPWPMLSRTVVDGIDPAQINLWNYNHFRSWTKAHYMAFHDWYAGLILGIFSFFSILMIFYIWKRPKEYLTAGVALILIWTGFLANLPIMFRVHFIVPGYAGLLGYKHMQSVVGAALLIAWAYGKAAHWINQRKLQINNNSFNWKKAALFFIFGGLIIYLLVNNFCKVDTAIFLKNRGLPW